MGVEDERFLGCGLQEEDPAIHKANRDDVSAAWMDLKHAGTSIEMGDFYTLQALRG